MRILIIGAAGYNLGDNAIAVLCVQQIKKHLDEAKIRVCTLKPNSISRHRIVEFRLDRKSITGWSRLFREITISDIVLLGGGTMIQDYLGCGVLRGMIPYMWQMTKMASFLRKPIATLPIGIDELTTSRGMRMAKSILTVADPVIVRDTSSASRAKDLLNEQKNKLLIAADPVFSLSINGSEGVSSNPYIVVSYVLERREITSASMELKMLVRALRKRWPEFNVVLLTMDTRQSEELSIYKTLREDFIDDGRVSIGTPMDFLEAARIIRGAKLVIAMRLHAMIMALGHVPLVGISYANKTDTLIKESNIYGASLNDGRTTEFVMNLAENALDDHSRLLWQKSFQKRASACFQESMSKLVACICAQERKAHSFKD